jgi:hypothetical protein
MVASAMTSDRRRQFFLFALLLVAIAGALGVYQGLKYRSFLARIWEIPPANVTLYDTDYWMGELVESISERGRYYACYTDVRSAQLATTGVCFSAHRMPVVTFFMVAVAKVFNNVLFLVTLKAVLVMSLLCVAIWMVASQAENWRPLAIALAVVFLANPSNCLIMLGPVSEESVLVAQMALAAAILFGEGTTPASMSTRRLLCLGLLVALMPMTKSSSFAPALVISLLVALYARRDKLAALLPIAMLAVSLTAWGTFTYRASGHFAFGSTLSSLNGYNLHHGYNPHYGEVAPRYNLDLPVIRGQITRDVDVRDEWEFNRYFADRAMKFVRENPGTAAWYLVIKTYVAVFKLTPEYQPYSGQDGFFLPKHFIITIGLTLNRLILWLALAASGAVCWTALRGTGWRSFFTNGEVFCAVTLIAVTLSFLSPFIIAFASVRNLTPVFYFVAPYLALFALRSPALRGSWASRVRRLVGKPVAT